MRRFVLLFLALFLTPAQAQGYPSRTIEIVVPFAAGGGTDLIARVLVERLSETMRQRFVIINRPGASTNIGTAAVANAQPDGYTLLLPAFRSPPTRRSTASCRMRRVTSPRWR